MSRPDRLSYRYGYLISVYPLAGRHSKDDKRHTESSASMLRVSAMHLILKRLKPTNIDPLFRYRALDKGFSGEVRILKNSQLRSVDATWAALKRIMSM